MKRSLIAAALGAALAAGMPTVAAPRAPKAPGPRTVVAKIGGKPVTLAEVDAEAARELFELRERTLDELINRRVIEAAAAKEKLPVDAWIQRTIESRVPPVSEAEAAAWFAENQHQMGPDYAGKSFDQVKDVIIRGMTNVRRREAVGQLIAELRQKAGVEVLLEPARVPVEAVGPARGPAGAPVTIVVFSDFECPYCARGRDVMDQVVAAYPGKVRVVHRDFPLSFHQKAPKAAEAGHCAEEQGKFWALHDWMFDHQDTLDPEDLTRAAAKLGLDQARFGECLSSGRHAATVAANLAAGEKAGVEGTPAYFINGRPLGGAQPFEKFKEIIDRELKSKR